MHWFTHTQQEPREKEAYNNNEKTKEIFKRKVKKKTENKKNRRGVVRAVVADSSGAHSPILY